MIPILHAGLPCPAEIFNQHKDNDLPRMGLVKITVEPAGPSWPDLGGSTFALAYAETTRRELTDAWGVARFRNVPLANRSAATIMVEE